MAAPGTSGKMPLNRNTVMGMRSPTASARQSTVSGSTATRLAATELAPAAVSRQ